MELIMSLIVFAAVLVVSGAKVINQYEKGVVLTLGKFSGVKEPGFRVVVPFFQQMIRVDTRTKTTDVPNQEVITKDNIPVQINAVVYYRVKDVEKATLVVENYRYAVAQLAQTTMRNAVGEQSLNDLLQKREQIAESIQTVLDEKTDQWGVDVQILELKDIVIPDDLKRTISKVAEAERERQAVIISSEGDKEAAVNLAEAARILEASPGALHLRTLQSINDLSSDQSNTTIWMVPVDMMNTIKAVGDKLSKK